jgi:glutamate synthase (NADPH/NADH) large chain/glutamate synthase (ferredoxin)
MTWSTEGGERGLRPAIEALCQLAERAVDDGKTILILSDVDVDKNSAPIPVLLATGAVHHHLRRVGKRHLTSIIAQSGEPREVHHVATLIGYGASAVQPWLAELTIARQVAQAPEEVASLIESWRAVLHKGLRKVMAKMGISVLRGYQGAQLFEAIGLSDEVIDVCFAGTRSGVGGVGFELLAAESLARHARGVTHERPESLDDQGHFRFRRDGELHAWSPVMLRAMKKFRKDADPEQYAIYRQANEERDPVTLRDLLTWKPAKKPVELSEVEPAREIVRRFTTAAMSLGSLSPETHRTLAVAMNRLGAKSNTGEGGEDPAYYSEPDGAEAIAAIKQVASGRFGVTTEYLMRADEIEIKMAQGSKPGEGGQIPGHKVTGLIARLRRSVPGVPLISPPPHHDIYSIEDLAQLIHDLRQVNPKARICVKLVAEAGVGTIAAGVAKAGADTILISGHDGGTGASPLSSIKNAGSPWELGLAETQQALVFNNLRERVLLRTDGGLKTGRDIVIAAMLGAEEYNFGTAALVALGCRYVRQCHSNTCPVGIATQREDLRERYDGDADQLVAFFIAVAEEVREHLALLGVRSLDELVGQTHLLEKRDLPDHPKAQTLDLQKLTAPPMPDRQVRSGVLLEDPHQPSLNDRIVADCTQALEHRIPVARSYHVRNTDRTVGARIAGKIVTRYGLGGLPRATIRLDLDGSAGQSFGAFLVDGVRMRLKGEANDYVGKGMSGGELIIRPMDYHHTDRINILAGNTVLYGATAGELFLAGAAGERFAVRNSGATAIVEGVGAHGCEYMTGGTVLILGPVGRNFAAGMTGGIAYVWDPEDKFESRYHPDFVRIERLKNDEDLARVEALVEQHHFMTQSPRAAELLELRRRAWSSFWKVTPLAATDSVSDSDSEDKRDVA